MKQDLEYDVPHFTYSVFIRLAYSCNMATYSLQFHAQFIDVIVPFVSRQWKCYGRDNVKAYIPTDDDEHFNKWLLPLMNKKWGLIS